MNTKLIVINGVMGVGKTTVSKRLYKELKNCFWLDGDNCWTMNPFIVNEENKEMVLNNISFILNNFLSNSSSKSVVFNWVIQSDDIMNEVLSRINTENVDVYKITLMCTKEELIRRIESDVRLGLRDNKNVERSLERYDMYKAMDTIKVDTTGKSIEKIVEEIVELVE
ncbi:shikimate kinase [uncultured Clostridium sp.]|uniref:AAA family ATPase n=1 Tax=uncultured Clostridium sp. TaxID=59620 RepID=UPI000820C8A8|nr:AAA family ATPase [uncultured Clostridium sp.]SCJ59936.1 shikimate kinase [uncultured Clostridium sp.]